MIKVGDKLPEATFTVMGEGGPQPKTTAEIFGGKKVALFGVPGAFTPTCHKNHLPSFRDKAAEIKGKGVDTIACVSVNDVFVMDAWGKETKANGVMMMLADGSGKFADATGLALDLSERGLGKRIKRFSMLVDDGVVRTLAIEEAPGIELTGADAMLKQL